MSTALQSLVPPLVVLVGFLVGYLAPAIADRIRHGRRNRKDQP